MEIAVIGGGPAGAWSSILLARQGHSVTLIDTHAPWEKPCGGGVTTKALSRFGIFDASLPRREVHHISVFFGDKESISIVPPRPLAVVSRLELGDHLLNEAARCNVRIIKDRVTQIRADGNGWRLTARATELHAEYLIGADGATSFVRKSLGQPLAPEDFCVTLGYFIPYNAQEQMKIYFVPSLEGYIWSFPRTNHLSYGLISTSGPGQTARAKALLSNFIVADLGKEVMESAKFYSAPVPCLRPRSWKSNVIAGKRWALVGDAAGLVDPITGEGIYFAFRSAEILAETIGQPDHYPKKVWDEIGRDLARGSRMYKRFYRGRFLGGDFRKRTIQLAGRSRTVGQLLGALLAGDQPYLTLKKRLVLSVPKVGWDLLWGRR